MNNTTAQLLTPEEAAAWLKVSPRTLASRRHKGNGPPFVRTGRVVRYPTDALAAWIAHNTITATA